MAGSASAVEAPVEDSGRVWDFRRGVPFQLPRGWSFVDRLDEGEGECSTPLAVRQGLMTDHAQSSVTYIYDYQNAYPFLAPGLASPATI